MNSNPILLENEMIYNQALPDTQVFPITDTNANTNNINTNNTNRNTTNTTNTNTNNTNANTDTNNNFLLIICH
jgi:hypothetical protein